MYYCSQFFGKIYVVNIKAKAQIGERNKKCFIVIFFFLPVPSTLFSGSIFTTFFKAVEPYAQLYFAFLFVFVIILFILFYLYSDCSMCPLFLLKFKRNGKIHFTINRWTNSTTYAKNLAYSPPKIEFRRDL